MYLARVCAPASNAQAWDMRLFAWLCGVEDSRTRNLGIGPRDCTVHGPVGWGEWFLYRRSCSVSNVEAQAVQMRRPADARPGDSQASPVGGPNDVVDTAESAGAEIWGPLSHKWPAPSVIGLG